MKRLIKELEIDNALRIAHNRQEDFIVNAFYMLLKPTIRPFVEFVSTTYDYNDDVYIIFSCNNHYVKDVQKEIEDKFNLCAIYDMGDNYSEFSIGLYDLKEANK